MRGARLAPQTIDTIAHTVRAGLTGSSTASPAFAQTADAPFGDVAHHVVRVDGVNFHYVTAGSGKPAVRCDFPPHKCGYLYGSSVELALDPG